MRIRWTFHDWLFAALLGATLAAVLTTGGCAERRVNWDRKIAAALMRR